MTVDPKPLHLATSLEKLDEFANKKELGRNTKLDLACKAADTLFDSAQSSANINDDEIQYVYYTRFVNLVKTIAHNCNDLAFVDSRFGRQVVRANERLAAVRKVLVRRYAEKAAETSQPTSTKGNEPKKEGSEEQKKDRPLFKSQYVTPEEVYKAYKDGENFIIWDARSAEDFQKSRMKDIKNINIPSNIIKKGYSANVLGQHIPKESLADFNSRVSYKAIVLMDWRTEEERFLLSVVEVLFNIISVWDTVRYEHPPYVLSGGFLAWMDKYPSFCTNPTVYFDYYYEELDDLLSLEGISYPSLMLMDVDGEDEKRFNKLLDLYESQIQEEKLLVKRYNELHELMSNNDSASSDITFLMNKIQEMEFSNTVLFDEAAKLQSEFTSLIHDKETNDKINSLERTLTNLRSERESLAEKTAVFKPPVDSTLPEVKEEDQEKNEGEVLKPIKPEIRRELKPDREREPPKPRPPTVPSFDRKTKPKMREVKLIDLLQDNRNVIYKGLTGLYNIHNTCYQNTLVQCLRHVPAVATFFLKKQYMHSLGDRKLKIIREFGDVVNKLWYSNEPYFRSQELYDRIIRSVDEIYGQGAHEDIHQFFLSIIDALVEDTKCKIVIDNSAAPSTRAWYSQLSYCTSFFSDNFFHQIVTKQLCNICVIRSVRYDMENVFMLSIPQELENRPFNLVDLMQIYLAGEAPRKVICKKCKSPIDNQRKMVKYPKIAVICIKRYKLAGSIWEKNEQPCIIPEELRIAETDYKLYSIAQHIGTMTKGHYTAACLNPVDKRWYHFNDSNVSVIPTIHSHDIYRKAYLLFYEAINKGEAGEKME